MQLTRYSDLSLRLLMYLAVRTGDRATIEEISRAYSVSKAHLTKVAHDLGAAGVINTVRGRGGGLQLARPPEEITVGDVIRHTEENLAIVECFEPAKSHCRIEPVCGLQGVLEEALQAFLRTLDGYTLADLVARRRQPLLRILTASSS